MPNASQIIAGLSAVANENLATALGWHALLAGAIASILMGWRPSRGTGLIPCPTLAVLTGVTVLLQSGLSRNWSIVLGVFVLFYGAFGVLRLGVWLDVVLLGGALYLLTLRGIRARP